MVPLFQLMADIRSNKILAQNKVLHKKIFTEMLFPNNSISVFYIF